MLHVPDVTGLTCVEAAQAYAAAGWFALPIVMGLKHPGSVLGKGWPVQSSRDDAQIARWFARGDYGLALHVGRSGAVAFDVDDPELMPAPLRDALACTKPPYQSTRHDCPGRGHYLYRQPGR